MAVTAFAYSKFINHLFSGNIDFDAHNFKLALLHSGYAPSQNTHEFFADVSGSEVSGAGYSAGGAPVTVTGVVTTLTETAVKISQVSWPGSTITARYAVLYRDTGTPATSPLVGYIDFGGDQATSGSTFTVSFTDDEAVLGVVGT